MNNSFQEMLIHTAVLFFLFWVFFLQIELNTTQKQAVILSKLKGRLEGQGVVVTGLLLIRCLLTGMHGGKVVVTGTACVMLLQVCLRVWVL